MERKNKMRVKWGRFAGIFFILFTLSLFFIFDLGQYLSFQALKTHHTTLIRWTNHHYFVSVLTFMVIYSIAVAISIPGATLFTLTGGFLFGLILGTIYVVVSATIGATLVFLAVRYALASWVAERTGKWIKKMRHGFAEDALSYLLILRLIPLFPFWVVNIIPALLNVPTRTYIMGTFFGIIPGTFVYVYLGTGLSHLFDQDKTPNYKIIFEPEILLPLIALAILSFLPTAYKRIKRKST